MGGESRKDGLGLSHISPHRRPCPSQVMTPDPWLEGSSQQLRASFGGFAKEGSFCQSQLGHIVKLVCVWGGAAVCPA